MDKVGAPRTPLKYAKEYDRSGPRPANVPATPPVVVPAPIVIQPPVPVP